MTKEKSDRKIVIPGEVVAKGPDFLPGEGTEKIEDEIVAIKYGLLEESNGLMKVIALSGTYQPRRGNVVIGKVENVTFYGWVINLDSADGAFLPLQEVPTYVEKEDMTEVLDIGEMVAAKIVGVSGRGVDLTIKLRGLGRIDEGMIVKVNPNKVPRVIGKEGSMISLIKEESGCEVTVGQNGLVWIQGKTIEEELLVKRAIEFISEKSFSHGLTEEVKEWFKKQKKE